MSFSTDTVRRLIVGVLDAIGTQVDELQLEVDESKAKQRNLEKGYIPLNEEIVELQGQLQAAHARVNEFGDKWHKSEERAATLEEQLKEMRQQLADYRINVYASRDRIVQLEKILRENGTPFPLDTSLRPQLPPEHITDSVDVAKWLTHFKDKVNLVCSNSQGVGVLRGKMEIDDAIAGIDGLLHIKFKV